MKLTVKELHDPDFMLDDKVKLMNDEQENNTIDKDTHFIDCLYDVQLQQVFRDRHFISWMVKQE